MTTIGRWMAAELGVGVPLHFTAYHPDYRLRSLPPTPAATLLRARSIALENGLRYVYTGNIRNPASQNTYCHRCGACLIGRDGYGITAWGLTDSNRCVSCHALCDGVFQVLRAAPRQVP